MRPNQRHGPQTIDEPQSIVLSKRMLGRGKRLEKRLNRVLAGLSSIVRNIRLSSFVNMPLAPILWYNKEERAVTNPKFEPRQQVSQPTREGSVCVHGSCVGQAVVY